MDSRRRCGRPRCRRLGRTGSRGGGASGAPASERSQPNHKRANDTAPFTAVSHLPGLRAARLARRAGSEPSPGGATVHIKSRSSRTAAAWPGCDASGDAGREHRLQHGGGAGAGMTSSGHDAPSTKSANVDGVRDGIDAPERAGEPDAPDQPLSDEHEAKDDARFCAPNAPSRNSTTWRSAAPSAGRSSANQARGPRARPGTVQDAIAAGGADSVVRANSAMVSSRASAVSVNRMSFGGGSLASAPAWLDGRQRNSGAEHAAPGQLRAAQRRLRRLVATRVDHRTGGGVCIARGNRSP